MHLSLLENLTHWIDALQTDWIEFGFTQFDWIVLEKCSVEILLQREQYYLDCCKPEYNINPIAQSRLGTKCSDETRARIGQASKGRTHSEKTKQQMRDSKLGHLNNLRLRKLNDEEVIYIKCSHEPAEHLAKRFNVDHSTIRNIREGRTYKNVF